MCRASRRDNVGVVATIGQMGMKCMEERGRGDQIGKAHHIREEWDSLDQTRVPCDRTPDDTTLLGRTLKASEYVRNSGSQGFTPTTFMAEVETVGLWIVILSRLGVFQLKGNATGKTSVPGSIAGQQLGASRVEGRRIA